MKRFIPASVALATLLASTHSARAADLVVLEDLRLEACGTVANDERIAPLFVCLGQLPVQAPLKPTYQLFVAFGSELSDSTAVYSTTLAVGKQTPGEYAIDYRGSFSHGVYSTDSRAGIPIGGMLRIWSSRPKLDVALVIEGNRSVYRGKLDRGLRSTSY